MPPTDAPSLKDIIRYYDQTQFDYQVAWLNEDNLAVHFGFYDRHTHRHADALVNTNRIMADKADIQAGDKVLDAGCGQGGSSFWLAAQRGAKTFGVSPVRTQIDKANAMARERGLSANCSFTEADFCKVPAEAGSFDVVWACESLCHAPDKSAFYQEAYRLLKPGGRLIIAEYVRYDRPLSQSQEQLLYDWLRRWAIPDIDSTQEHQQHMAEAGFEAIAIEDYTPYAFISLKNLHQIARRWMWANYILYGLGIRKRAQHHNIVGSVRQFQALRAAAWYYALISARKG
jgi:cyclopropane fatty-acyl-phospholipid synthase-like methyltransferase